MAKQVEKVRFADVHCHILPGVDDGAQNLAEATEMVRIAAEEGITDMLLTPHFIGRSPGKAAYEQALNALKSACERENIRMNFALGNELYYLDGIDEKIESGKALTLNGTNCILVEFGTDADYMYIRNALSMLKASGYQPIIAHIERYQKLLDIEKVEFLHEAGIEIQVNASTISGEAGFGPKLFARKLLDRGLVDFVGTDAHNTGRRAPRVKKCLKVLYGRYDAEYVDQIVYENAKSLMER